MSILLTPGIITQSSSKQLLLDQFPGSFAFSLRHLSSSVISSSDDMVKVMRVIGGTGGTDDVETWFSIDEVQDLSSLASWAGVGNNAEITQMVCQISGNIATRASTTARPILVNSGTQETYNGLPSIKTRISGKRWLDISWNPTVGGSYVAAFSVANHKFSGSTGHAMRDILMHRSNTGLGITFGGQSSGTYTAGWGIEVGYTGASSGIRTNGSEYTLAGTPVKTNFDSLLTVFNRNSTHPTAYLGTDDVYEQFGIGYDASGDLDTIEGLIDDYYGNIFLP